jgi:hypothetical protein
LAIVVLGMTKFENLAPLVAHRKSSIGGLPVDSVGVYRVRSEVSNFRITDPYRMSIPLTF